MTTRSPHDLHGSVVVDTNIILRWILDDVPDQAQAATQIWLLAADGVLEVFIPVLVVFETVFTLERTYHHSPERVTRVIREMASLPHVTVESWEQITAALERHTTTRLGFADCFIVAVAESRQPTTLLTFDQQLLRQSPVAAVDPRNITNGEGN